MSDLKSCGYECQNTYTYTVHVLKFIKVSNATTVRLNLCCCRHCFVKHLLYLAITEMSLFISIIFEMDKESNGLKSTSVPFFLSVNDGYIYIFPMLSRPSISIRYKILFRIFGLLFFIDLHTLLFLLLTIK